MNYVVNKYNLNKGGLKEKKRCYICTVQLQFNNIHANYDYDDFLSFRITVFSYFFLTELFFLKRFIKSKYMYDIDHPDVLRKGPTLILNKALHCVCFQET